MRFTPVLALAASLLPVVAIAQEPAPPPPQERLAPVDKALSDPATQKRIGQMLRVLGEVVLDMPLAPLAEAAADMAGEKAADIPPGATLRSIVPQASRLPEQIERTAPRALDAAGSLARALETMMPTLRDMAKSLEEVTPPPR